MTASDATATAVLEQYTAHLPPPPDEPWAVQSLAEGSAGTSLLHIEMIDRYGGSWRFAHRWITAASYSASGSRAVASSGVVRLVG
ncbi:hypothetical protein ACWGJX_40100 [Streptomyces sp. NPDC054775]